MLHQSKSQKNAEQALIVGIDLGIDNLSINDITDGLKQKELEKKRNFEENNPEVNLPENLGIDVVPEDFPPLVNFVISPVMEGREKVNESWVQIAFKG